MRHRYLTLAAFLATACALPAEPAPPAPEKEPPIRGGQVGKGDVVGSCRGQCGEGSRGCWCDPSCVDWGDCCDDYRAACETLGEVRMPDRLPRDATGIPVFVDLFDAARLTTPLRVEVEAPLRLVAVGHATASPAGHEGDTWRGTKPLAWLDVDCPDERCDPATIRLFDATDGSFVAAKSISFGPAEGALSEVPCRDAPHLLHHEGPDGARSRVEGVWSSSLEGGDGFHLRVVRGGPPVDRIDLVLAERPRLGEPIALGADERLSVGGACPAERIIVHELAIEDGAVSRVSLSWWGQCHSSASAVGLAPPPFDARGCVRVDHDAPPWLVPFNP